MLQDALEFIGMGCWKIEIFIDSSSARSFLMRRGVGRLKHIDAKQLWLQDLVNAGGLITKKIERLLNVSDMLTHVPSANPGVQNLLILRGPLFYTNLGNTK